MSTNDLEVVVIENISVLPTSPLLIYVINSESEIIAFEEITGEYIVQQDCRRLEKISGLEEKNAINKYCILKDKGAFFSSQISKICISPPPITI